MVEREQAQQFAIILSSGVPQLDALKYMLPEADAGTLKDNLPVWLADGGVQRAILAIQGKPWEGMSLQEKITFAISKHYTELAYFLYSHNYVELSGPERNKADVCRATLEAKLAGMAGKMDPLSTFLADLMAKRTGGGQRTPPSPHPLMPSAPRTV